MAWLKGSKCNMLLLCSPNNPLGFVYRRQDLAAVMKWAVEQGMHVVSDEIYGGTIHTSTTPFHSVWKIAAEDFSPEQQEQVHVLTSLSKDLAVPGLRVGIFATKNKRLLSGMDGVAKFNTLNGWGQQALAEVLMDDTFIDQHLIRQNTLMRAAYQQLTVEFDRNGIRYLDGGATLVVWMDLRNCLPQNATWRDEELLHELLMMKGIPLTMGKACNTDEPGFFRICPFAIDPTGYPEVASRIGSCRLR